MSSTFMSNRNKTTNLLRPLNLIKENSSNGLEFRIESSGEVTYKGFFKGAVLHGIGSKTTPTYTYIGEFENGIFEGCGLLQQPSKGVNIYSNWRNGQFHQFWYFEDTKNKLQEVGEIYAEKLNGRGKTVDKEQSSIGYFSNGSLDGIGKINNTKFDYVGEFSKGEFHGRGVLQDFVFGSKYIGMFKHGVKHGYGILKTEGRTIRGAWVRDKLEGKALVYTLKDGNKPRIVSFTFGTTSEIIKANSYDIAEIEINSSILDSLNDFFLICRQHLSSITNYINQEKEFLTKRIAEVETDLNNNEIQSSIHFISSSAIDLEGSGSHINHKSVLLDQFNKNVSLSDAWTRFDFSVQKLLGRIKEYDGSSYSDINQNLLFEDWFDLEIADDLQSPKKEIKNIKNNELLDRVIKSPNPVIKTAKNNSMNSSIQQAREINEILALDIDKIRSFASGNELNSMPKSEASKSGPEEHLHPLLKMAQYDNIDSKNSVDELVLQINDEQLRLDLIEELIGYSQSILQQLQRYSNDHKSETQEDEIVTFRDLSGTKQAFEMKDQAEDQEDKLSLFSDTDGEEMNNELKIIEDEIDLLQWNLNDSKNELSQLLIELKLYLNAECISFTDIIPNLDNIQHFEVSHSDSLDRIHIIKQELDLRIAKLTHQYEQSSLTRIDQSRYQHLSISDIKMRIKEIEEENIHLLSRLESFNKSLQKKKLISKIYSKTAAITRMRSHLNTDVSEVSRLEKDIKDDEEKANIIEEKKNNPFLKAIRNLVYSSKEKPKKKIKAIQKMKSVSLLLAMKSAARTVPSISSLLNNLPSSAESVLSSSESIEAKISKLQILLIELSKAETNQNKAAEGMEEVIQVDRMIDSSGYKNDEALANNKTPPNTNIPKNRVWIKEKTKLKLQIDFIRELISESQNVLKELSEIEEETMQKRDEDLKKLRRPSNLDSMFSRIIQLSNISEVSKIGDLSSRQALISKVFMNELADHKTSELSDKIKLIDVSPNNSYLYCATSNFVFRYKFPIFSDFDARKSIRALQIKPLENNCLLVIEDDSNDIIFLGDIFQITKRIEGSRTGERKSYISRFTGDDNFILWLKDKTSLAVLNLQDQKVVKTIENFWIDPQKQIYLAPLLVISSKSASRVFGIGVTLQSQQCFIFHSESIKSYEFTLAGAREKSEVVCADISYEESHIIMGGSCKRGAILIALEFKNSGVKVSKEFVLSFRNLKSVSAIKRVPGSNNFLVAGKDTILLMIIPNTLETETVNIISISGTGQPNCIAFNGSHLLFANNGKRNIGYIEFEEKVDLSNFIDSEKILIENAIEEFIDSLQNELDSALHIPVFKPFISFSQLCDYDRKSAAYLFENMKTYKINLPEIKGIWNTNNNIIIQRGNSLQLVVGISITSGTEIAKVLDGEIITSVLFHKDYFIIAGRKNDRWIIRDGRDEESLYKGGKYEADIYRARNDTFYNPDNERIYWQSSSTTISEFSLSPLSLTSSKYSSPHTIISFTLMGSSLIALTSAAQNFFKLEAHPSAAIALKFPSFLASSPCYMWPLAPGCLTLISGLKMQIFEFSRDFGKIEKFEDFDNLMGNEIRDCELVRGPMGVGIAFFDSTGKIGLWLQDQNVGAWKVAEIEVDGGIREGGIAVGEYVMWIWKGGEEIIGMWIQDPGL